MKIDWSGSGELCVGKVAGKTVVEVDRIGRDYFVFDLFELGPAGLPTEPLKCPTLRLAQDTAQILFNVRSQEVI